MLKDKRKLAAIMFVDIVGYSRMMASNEERTLELLKDFENICSPIISSLQDSGLRESLHATNNNIINKYFFMYISLNL